MNKLCLSADIVLQKYFNDDSLKYYKELSINNSFINSTFINNIIKDNVFDKETFLNDFFKYFNKKKESTNRTIREAIIQEIKNFYKKNNQISGIEFASELLNHFEELTNNTEDFGIWHEAYLILSSVFKEENLILLNAKRERLIRILYNDFCKLIKKQLGEFNDSSARIRKLEFIDLISTGKVVNLEEIKNAKNNFLISSMNLQHQRTNEKGKLSRSSTYYS